MHKRILQITLCVLLIHTVYSVSAQSTLSSIPLRPQVNFSVVHNGSDSSVLYFRINPKSLLHIKPDSSLRFIKRFTIEGVIYNNQKKQVVDTLSVTFTDTSSTSNSINDSICFALSTGDYVLNIALTDLNKNSRVEHRLAVNKTDFRTAPYFLIKGMDGFHLCSDMINQDEMITIQHTGIQTSTLYVDYIINDYPSVDPPFIIYPEDYVKIQIDSSFTLQQQKGGQFYLEFKKNGIYHIRIDSSHQYGVILSKYHKNFPRVTDAKDLLMPLKYITTKNDFRKLIEAPDAKLALDAFWLDKAKSHDRARKAIERFYSRVEYANTYFTSYKEGWKTDRGCILIVYGVPTTISYEGDEEIWNYGEPGNINNLKFVFQNKPNRYSTNHYQLERSTTFRNSWFLSTENWQ